MNMKADKMEEVERQRMDDQIIEILEKQEEKL